jgi:5'(3')-deoxyribonucleotidase
MISDAIKTAFEKKIRRGWDKWPHMYWAIDLHDVIIPGTYTRNNDGRQFYPNAEEVLQWLSSRQDMCIILYTSSHEDSISDIINWLADQHIVINYVNENPECKDTDLCSFSSKFYFDIMLEDKAGFMGMTDWRIIKDTLKELNEWQKKEIH